ncbi:uncharacterized protein [Salminus brasiliensis]|uniref:uncharacterized protein n=1 Tax=Salminus brasiliensis TaxID=930266 RepID=UPI003B8370EA
MCSMMAMVTQLIFLLAVFNLITGSRDVPVLVGSSVQLDIQDKDLTSEDLSWKHNENRILKFNSKYNHLTLYDPYKDSVEFNKGTYSLTLKKVQKTDSGLYEAQISGQKDITVAQYNLTVFDPVEAPVITHLQNYDISSNITLICRGHDLSINFSCSKEPAEKKVTSPGGIILSLFVTDSSIICNHSNSVSWKVAKMQMETLRQLCLPEGETSSSAGVSVCLMKTGLYSITLLLMLSAIITVHIREKLIKPS